MLGPPFFKRWQSVRFLFPERGKPAQNSVAAGAKPCYNKAKIKELLPFCQGAGGSPFLQRSDSMNWQPSTIAAIATPLGVGGIGVIRISGPDAVQTAEAIFSPAGGKALSSSRGYTAHYGRLHDQDGDFDEVVATVFRAPRSYTGEDVVELSCHGGMYLVQRALRAALDHGAVLAQPGEFTKRAYLNGKVSLAQAESVMDLIGASGRQAARAALAGRDGVLSRKIDGIAEALIDLAAHLAAWNDYPDEDMESVEPASLAAALRRSLSECRALLGSYDAGRILREGVDTAIIGRPNVGKSTL
ncbi:MAG TPA: hypothetical protein DEP43_05225, partial [Ruminococcaceae bacterium]|nr:hypothetical protein [Oscillospiraceae bacterium]